MQTRAATGERSPELSLTLQFSLLQHSHKPVEQFLKVLAILKPSHQIHHPKIYIYSVHVFKAGFLILNGRLTCCDRRVRGFGGSSEPWLQPSSASASCTAVNEPPGKRTQAWKGVPGGFSIPIYNTCAPVSHRIAEDTSFKGLKVLRNTADFRMNT